MLRRPKRENGKTSVRKYLLIVYAIALTVLFAKYVLFNHLQQQQQQQQPTILKPLHRQHAISRRNNILLRGRKARSSVGADGGGSGSGRLEEPDIDTLLDPECSSVGKERKEGNIKKIKHLLSDQQLQERLENCEEYFRSIPVAATEEKTKQEEDPSFQLAFSHQVHKDIGMLEMFLAVMFRPQNIHCIHVDQKAPKRVHQSVASLVRCYSQRFGQQSMFVIKNPISVYWGHISVLDADLICLHELMERHEGWKYFVNTAGTEMPIVNYTQFVRVAKRAQGDNVLESYKMPQFFHTRINRYFHLERYGPRKYDLRVVRTNFTKPPPPFRLTIYKGLKNVLITRNFSDFVLNDPVAIEFYKWLEDIRVPDELFYQTLSRIVDIKPDVVVQDHGKNTALAGNPRFTLWAFEKKNCYGRWIRLICNFALEDLPMVRRADALLANKFNLAVDARAPVCQWKYLRDGGQGQDPGQRTKLLISQGETTTATSATDYDS